MSRRLLVVGGSAGTGKSTVARTVRFDLHACVQALFGMRFPNQDQQAA